jgi:hypothetical protein
VLGKTQLQNNDLLALPKSDKNRIGKIPMTWQDKYLLCFFMSLLILYFIIYIYICIYIHVPDNKSWNIPEVVLVRRWAFGVLGIWKGWDSWVKGGANGVSIQAT